MRFAERVLLLMSLWSISHRTVKGDNEKSGLAEWWSKNVDSCEWEGVPGRCVPPEQCISTNQFVPGLVHPQNCSSVGSTLSEGVCCTDCPNVFGFNPAKQKASDLLIDPKGTIHYKTGQKSWDSKYQANWKNDSFPLRFLVTFKKL